MSAAARRPIPDCTAARDPSPPHESTETTAMKKLFILSLAALPMILSGCPKDEEPNTEKVEKAVDDAKDAADDEK
jgi:hypothetical protein